MANGIDESAFLGSALSVGPVAPQPDTSKAKVDQVEEKRKTVKATLLPAVNLLTTIVENQIAKEKDLEVVRGRSVQRVKQGQTQREALADEVLYSAGRLDALLEIKNLLDATKSAGKRGNDG